MKSFPWRLEVDSAASSAACAHPSRSVEPLLPWWTDGVGNTQELEWARPRGADDVQGFTIARPGPSPRPATQA